MIYKRLPLYKFVFKLCPGPSKRVPCIRRFVLSVWSFFVLAATSGSSPRLKPAAPAAQAAVAAEMAAQWRWNRDGNDRWWDGGGRATLGCGSKEIVGGGELGDGMDPLGTPVALAMTRM